MLAALRKGRVAGYGADVLSGEFALDFEVNAHPLVRYALKHDNVLLTPHIAGSTIDAWCETQNKVIESAIEHFRTWKV